MRAFKYYIIFIVGIIIFLSSSAYLFKDIKSDARKNIKEVSKIVYDNSKRIKFNHKFHVTDQGVKCEDCHTGAVNSVSSKDNLNPKMDVCATCHDVKDEKNCTQCHYDKNYKKLNQTNRQINFSHKFHIGTQNKKCLDCHQDLDKVKFSKESSAPFPTMETCYNCHNNQKATTNCEGCHTNLTTLKPKDHKKSNFLNEHKFVNGNTLDNKCMMCHTDNFCQVCHSPIQYNGQNTKENFYVPFYSKEGATRIDREDLQKLTTVHNLNYRFTHALDANNKTYECKTCHDPVSFCASCHQNNGEIPTGIAPSSHLKPNFFTMGVNTGGGIHAKLARQDIEQCQTCHDVQGGDPICIKCHYDNDGIKGTNPKTHETGFMKDEKGMWHDTQGAVCYTCHTDPQAKPNGIKGVGFCGYCHN